MPRDLTVGRIEEMTFGAPAPKLYAGVRQPCRLTEKPKFKDWLNSYTEIYSGWGKTEDENGRADGLHLYSIIPSRMVGSFGSFW